MLDHIILTVSDVKRSLKFYTAALRPLKIKMFEPYKGADGHPDLWGFGDGQKVFFWLKQGQPDPASINWGSKFVLIGLDAVYLFDSRRRKQ